VPGAAQQVSEFLSKNDTRVDVASTFFIVFGGFNDIFFSPNLTAVQIATALSGSVTALINAGACHLLLLNYYDASEIPYAQFTDVTMKNEPTAECFCRNIQLHCRLHSFDISSQWKHYLEPPISSRQWAPIINRYEHR
jgi:phospholipase/lecithinase/hemolysin